MQFRTLLLIASGGLLAVAAARAAGAGMDGNVDTITSAAATDDVGDDTAPAPDQIVDGNDTIPVPTSAAAGGRAPRGIRNNNPGNIIATNITWRGKTGNDGAFEIFDSAVDGIRALALNLVNKARRGLVTVRSIITSWAPPAENDTASYIAAVAGALGVAADAQLNLTDPNTLTALADAIIIHENGYNPYPPATIAAGVNAALS
jgi:hypothetical protein